MSSASYTSDPRTIVTPDAFEVDSGLLGFPLASPGRRALAILIDLVVIGLLTTLPGVLLGIVAAALFLRIWGKSEKGDPLARAFKWTMGCFGAFVLFVTIVIFAFVATDLFDGSDSNPPVPGAVQEGSEDGSDAPGASEGVLSGLGLGDLVRGARSVAGVERSMRQLREAESESEAQAAANELARSLQDLNASRSQIREALEEAVDDAPPWDGDVLVEEALASLDASSPTAPGSERAEEEATTPAPVFSPAAEDSFAALQGRLADLEDDLDDARDDLARTERRLEQAREESGGGFLAGLWSFADNLGLGFGWGSLYLTIFMVWWKGQTVGKRLLDIRVVRLDGEPLGWFVAFERAGGYAAGFATGLLGFAQIWWDSNRQAIHDKIVGTVVLKDGEDRVPGPWMAD